MGASPLHTLFAFELAVASCTPLVPFVPLNWLSPVVPRSWLTPLLLAGGELTTDPRNRSSRLVVVLLTFVPKQQQLSILK